MTQQPQALFGAIIAACGLAGAAGCAGPGPELFPVVSRVEKRAQAGEERYYDADGDGRIDYCELLGGDGRIARLRYSTRQDGVYDRDVDLSALPQQDCRELFIILDSVPYELAREVYARGRLRMFHPPARVIAPFPVMTDLSLAEFYDVSPSAGVEAEYYDGRRLTDGFDAYAHEANTPWLPCVDYRMNPANHAVAYFYPHGWFGHEMRAIQRLFFRGDKRSVSAYTVCPSGLGAMEARNGHLHGLIHVDRFCQHLLWKTQGRVRITLMSDHGHNLADSKPVPLTEQLAWYGYRVTQKLEKPGDIVVPTFGLVTCAAIYTKEPHAVARDAAGIEGVELAAWHDDAQDVVVVHGRDSRATIAWKDGAFRYDAQRGDPLNLLPVWAALGRDGRLRPDGFADDRVLFDATATHEFPDALNRLWRAFHGLTRFRPDVLLSIDENHHCGSRFMDAMYYINAAHGNLRLPGSSGMAMTTAGLLPDVVRMAELKRQFTALGLTVDRRDGPATPQVRD